MNFETSQIIYFKNGMIRYFLGSSEELEEYKNQFKGQIKKITFWDREEDN